MYLASDESKYVTGTLLTVDGGATSHQPSSRGPCCPDGHSPEPVIPTYLPVPELIL